jgi:hypothetical protein
MIAWYWNILDTPWCEMTIRKSLSLVMLGLGPVLVWLFLRGRSAR